jgi:hypothetical protein
VAVYNTSSDEQIIAENQANDVQDEQELPGQCTHHNEIINSVGKATYGNDDPSKDPDHTIDAENTIIDEPGHTLDSMEINIVGEANKSNGHPSQGSDVTVNAENSNVDEPKILLLTGERILMLMNLIFMIVPKQMMEMLSRQIQLLMVMLNKMMYAKILFKAYKTKL